MNKFMCYRLRSQAARAALMLLVTALLVSLSIWGYFPPLEGETQPLEAVISEHKFVGTALGVRTLAAPSEYIVGVCFTALLPFITVLFQCFAANASLVRWISSGEARPFLMSSKSKALPVFFYWLQMLIWSAAQYLLVLFICIAGGYLKQKWQVNLPGLLRVCLAMWCFSGMTAGIIAFFTARAEGRLPFKALALGALFSGLRAAVNFNGTAGLLRFATPFSLLRLWDTFYGKSTALLLMPLMPALGALLAFVGGLRLERREFYH